MLWSVMTRPDPRWRPPPLVRPIAIGFVRRGAALLLMPVHDDVGAIKGWRAPGGAIEFGERAEDAVVREFDEEFGIGLTDLRRLCVVENIYEHEGSRGHEIVFVYGAAFEDRALYAEDRFRIRDHAYLHVEWVDRSRFFDGGEALFPTDIAAQPAFRDWLGDEAD